MALSDYQVWFSDRQSALVWTPGRLSRSVNIRKRSRRIWMVLGAIPLEIVYKPVLTTAEEIYGICSEANNDARCVGVIAWMHTFSPAKNWIARLSALQKPLLHLHTQYNRDIPWSEIDMDFMNSESGGARRPRVWIHHEPAAVAAQGRGWPLA